MTLDDAITYHKKTAKDARDNIINHNSLDWKEKYSNSQLELYARNEDQLVTWLEELKAYREIGTVEGYKNAIECYTAEYTIRKSNVQYDKAINDFVHECDKYCGFYNGENKNITREDILRIAEKLKTYRYAKD